MCHLENQLSSDSSAHAPSENQNVFEVDVQLGVNKPEHSLRISDHTLLRADSFVPVESVARVFYPQNI